MRWRPFDAKSLQDIDADDLQRLIDEEIEEGYFVEYKSAWESRKVARAVASFANTWGGTLIVGMEAHGLKPTKRVGIEDDGGLEERVVNTIRTSVAPVPSFAVRTVGIGRGRACVLVEVPEGTQPPYLLIRTGQILVRTPTSSEPVGINDREALDRLFARGERGYRWAKEKGHQLAIEAASDGEQPYVWTVPAIADGLGANAVIFRPTFLQQLGDLGRTFSHVIGVRDPELRTGPESVQATHKTVDDDIGGFFQIGVETTGTVWSTWRVPQVSAGLHTIKGLLEQALPMHRTVLLELLRHRGDLVVAAANRWPNPSGEFRSARAVRERVSVAELGTPQLLGALDRELNRWQGRLVYEPE